MSARARLCCLDLDTFFVSVERRLDPRLCGVPVIVGGQPGQRGVVAACSYEARQLGVRSGMPLSEAGRLAPQARYLSSRHELYARYAAEVRKIAARYSPEIQVASIDEMYMSFHGCDGLYMRPGETGDEAIERTVRALTEAIRAELGLPASAGIAATRSMSKIASGLAKPAGVLFVRAGEEPSILSPLPVRKLPGIGPVSEAKLSKLGVQTLGQLAERPVSDLKPVFGIWAEGVKRAALGWGSSELGPERPAFREHDIDGSALGSISNERTFPEDVRDGPAVRSMLCALAERVAWRARKRGVQARTVGLKLRYADFRTLTRSRTLGMATCAEPEIHDAVLRLYREANTRSRRVRLVGIQLSGLVLADQLELLAERRSASGRPVRAAAISAVDEIRERFGYDALRRAEGIRANRPV